MAKKALDMMIVASKVKAYIKANGCMTASDSLPALNAKLACVLNAAIARTKGNKRSTVKPQDL